MKRILAAVLAAVMAVSLMGCAGAGGGKSHKSTGGGTIAWLNTATENNIENLKKNEGCRGDGGVYKDITHKWVVCYVQVDDVLDEETGETYPEYMVKLGDVHVESIEKMR